MNHGSEPSITGKVRPQGAIRPIYWLILIVVLLALGFYFYQTLANINKESDSALTFKPAASATPSPLGPVYIDKTYDFSLTIPWKGYLLEKNSLKNANEATLANYTVKIPSTADPSGYYEAFYFGVATPAQWAIMQAAEGSKPILITQTSQYVFYWSINSGVMPSDLASDESLSPKYIKDNIILTFKLTNVASPSPSASASASPSPKISD